MFEEEVEKVVRQGKEYEVINRKIRWDKVEAEELKYGGK